MAISPRPSQKADNHLYLVDGSSFLFRAFHALPILTRADGTPVNAVLGFTNMLMKLLDDMHADHIAVIFDAGRETFRNELAPSYKANRPEPPDELIPQFPLVREATRAFNVPCLEMPGFEADDLIATYCRLAEDAGLDVTIVSSDKDLMQLVSSRISMFDAIKNRWIGPDEVRDKFGVGPEKVIDVQALAGDSIDNVPGVPGIGIKTAAQLINQYGDLDSLLAQASNIPQAKRRESLIRFADAARLSRELVRLRSDVPVTLSIEALVHRPADPATLMKFLSEQNFKSVLAKVQSRYAAQGNATSPGEDVLPAGTVATSKTQYELVQSLPALQDWVTRARYAGLVAVDTETTSLDENRAELVGISLCVEPGRACYIPLAHRKPGPTNTLNFEEPPKDTTSETDTQLPFSQIPIDQAIETLKPLLADPAILKIGHNIKYDMVVLARYDIQIAPVDDTMLMSYVLEGGSHGHGMDELADLYLGHTTIKYKDVTGTGKSQITFDLVPLEQALDYAAEDADVTMQLHRFLKPRLIAEHMVTLYETIERPLIPVLAEMERHGIKIARAEMAQLSREFANRLSTLEKEIHGLAGHPFNVASPKQVGKVLFDELKLPGGEKGKSGAYATGADVLETLAASGHPLPVKILDFRQLDKLKSTYADALVEQINPRTGRVHTSYAMAAASTGRLASTDPNLQNIPVRTEEGRKIRHAFIAEPGYQLLSLDYSQIELRLLAHIADIEPLKQAFREGQDIHALTASQVFGVPVKDLTPQLRRQAKAINFGIIYGISAFGLARQLGVPQEEAAAYIEAYFDRYPGIRDYMERTKQFAREHGYVETLFGRRCYVPGIQDKNPARRSFAERAAINAPMQGTAADILKRAMIRVPPALEQATLTEAARMLLTVHDELLFEVQEEAREHTAQVVRAVMESATKPAIHLAVPLTVDVGYGQNWEEAH